MSGNPIRLAEVACRHARTCVAAPEFDRAMLVLADGSHIEFDHSSRQSRWARASAEGTTADAICRALSGFRLNAKHLQLFFEDGNDVEFDPRGEDEMALPWDKREFSSWRKALAEGVLGEEQRTLLEEMVRKGDAESIEAAADLLDWQESVVDPDEHMYGM